MNLEVKRLYLIRTLLDEEDRYRGLAIPSDSQGQRDLLRALMNVRPPRPISNRFLSVQDSYLQELLCNQQITPLSELKPFPNGLYLWQGDITKLECDAIVNAANSGLTGCHQPLHYCVDNAIHTYAGIQLRLKCAELIERQGHPEPAGQAKLTQAYNLPCRWILHTVGPIVDGPLTERHCSLLASCYRSCLELADQNGIESIAFCCISTGVFGFPRRQAAEIALQTVEAYRQETQSKITVLFNVFREDDFMIYRKLLLKGTD